MYIHLRVVCCTFSSTAAVVNRRITLLKHINDDEIFYRQGVTMQSVN